MSKFKAGDIAISKPGSEMPWKRIVILSVNEQEGTYYYNQSDVTESLTGPPILSDSESINRLYKLAKSGLDIILETV